MYLRRLITKELVEDNIVGTVDVSACDAVLMPSPDDRGTCAIAVNAANAVTEGWHAIYDAPNNQWNVSSDAGSNGTLALQGDGSWQGTGGQGGNARVTLTIIHVPGKAAFSNGDTFYFSTFKSSLKKNEITGTEMDVYQGP